MNKMQIAHDCALAYIKYGDGKTHYKDVVEFAWQYADAMQAEADERNKAEAEQKRKEVREMLNADNTFIEREGQHFDDVADIQKPYTSSEEWQPDWSQAPEWAKWWAIDGFGDKKAHWYKDKPYLDDDSAIEDEWNADLDSQKESFVKAPSFNYQGDWKDSLRKRPEALCEVDWRIAPNDAIGWMIFDGVSTWLGESGYLIEDAPSFGLTGNHIVERPR